MNGLTNLPPPTPSPRYQFLAQLGQGGMGRVYRAYDRLTQSTVALKQINLSAAATAGDPKLTLALALEFRALATLRHPHIVSVLDYGFDDKQRPYYTMQLMENARPLTAYAAALDTPEIIDLVIQMLQALVYLHRRGIVHRDLKPENVLVTADGQVKVLDFGMAIEREAAIGARTTLGGTLAYMAPELLRGGGVTEAVDLYAVGVILYELFGGRLPFSTEQVTRFVQAVAHEEPNLAVLPSWLAPIAGRLLAKDPATRYPSAEAVIQALCQATNRPFPPETVLQRESFLQASAFVGRKTEFETLLTALDNTIQGVGSLWLVGGESGVGKSRLLDELRTRALIKGALVLRGQAVAEGGLPYQLWRDVVRRLILESTVDDLEAGVLMALVPDIDTLLERPVPPAPLLPSKDGQQRLIQTITALFRRQTRPILLLLEDLQWAEESMLPLRHMVGLQQQLPHLLIVGSYRDDECPNLPAELPKMSVLPLPRLSQQAVATLTYSMLGPAIGRQPDVVSLVQQQSEGNAFFIVETVRALAEEAGNLEAIGQLTLPARVFTGGIQRIVERRLSRMPAAYHTLLQLAAVAGRALDWRILQQVADGVEGESFLIAGAQASVFEVVDGVWRFAHDKLREGVLVSLSDEQQRTLSHRIAQALEAAYPNDNAYLEVVMEHWRTAGDSEREKDYVLPTANYLCDTVAEYDRTYKVVARGLDLFGDDDPRLPALLNIGSTAAHRKGDIDRSIAMAQRARELAQRLGDEYEIARSLNNLGVSRNIRANLADGIAYQQQALTLYRKLGHLQGVADCLMSLGSLTSERGDFSAAVPYYTESLELRVALNDKRGIAGCWLGLGFVADLQGDFATARDYYERSLNLYREVGNKQGIADCYNNLGAVTIMEGKHAAATHYFEQSRVICRDIGDLRGEATALHNIAEAWRILREYAKASAYHHQALALRRASGETWMVSSSLLGLGLVAHGMRAWDEAQGYYEECLVMQRTAGNWLGLAETLTAYAYLRVQLGQANAEAMLREAIAHSRAMDAVPAILSTVAVLGYWRLRAGDAHHAAQLIGLVGAHPANLIETQMGIVADTLHELRAYLSADDLHAACQQGASLDLMTTLEDLLQRDWSQWAISAAPTPTQPIPPAPHWEFAAVLPPNANPYSTEVLTTVDRPTSSLLATKPDTTPKPAAPITPAGNGPDLPPDPTIRLGGSGE